MCDKVLYTKIEAKSALNSAQKSPKKYRREKRIYYCDKCEGWHLTSQDYFKKGKIKLIEPERWERLLGS